MAEVFAALTQMINDYLGRKDVYSVKTSFPELELDSLDTFDLIAQIEEKFNIVFDEDFTISTLGELAAEIEKRINQRVKTASGH